MARSFNGTTAFIDFGTSVPNPGGQVTVSYWVRPTSLANAYTGLTSWGNGVSKNCSTYVESSGKIAFYTRDSTGTQVSIDPGTGVLSINTWYHLAFTVTSACALTAYINGISDSTAAGTSNPLCDLTGIDLQAGQDSQVGSRFLTGSMADIAIWNVVLTAGEILALAGGARPNKIRATRILFAPIDGLASPEPDLSGNHNNGTLTATALAPGPPINPLTPRWPRFLSAAAAASTVVQRRTLDNLGTRVGSRQLRAA